MLVVESDALKVINLVNGVDSAFYDIQVFIEDINFVGKAINAFCFCHVPREENKATHVFAVLAFSLV